MADETPKPQPTVAKVSRPVFEGIQVLLEYCKLQDWDPSVMEADFLAGVLTSGKHDAAAKWLVEKRDIFLRGLVHGFCILRYRMRIDYADGTSCFLRQLEDKAKILEYSKIITRGWQDNGFVIKPNEDGSHGIYHSDGKRKHCDYKVEVVSGTPVPPTAQRDPPEVPEPEPDPNEKFEG